MRIVFYYSSIYNGGAERVITSLADDFSKRGAEVYILTSDDGKCGYTLSEEVNVVPLNLMKKTENLRDAAKGILREISVLRKELRRIRPEILLAFSARMAVTAKWAAGGMPVKVVGSERTNPYVLMTGWKEQLFVKQTGILDGFIFQTNGAKQFYPKSTQIKSAVIPNAVSCSLPDIIPSFSERKPFSLIATGRIVPEKRNDIMVDAMKVVVRSFPEAKLDIYGVGEKLNDIEKYIHSQGMDEHIVLRGRTMNIPEQLISHQVFLLSSDYEGMPNGLIEAMAAGCVCISSDCGFGPAELITNGTDGLLFPMGDSKKLAELILHVFNHLDAAAIMAQEAVKINERLSFKVISDTYYRYLISR